MASQRVQLIIEAKDARQAARDVDRVAGSVDRVGMAADRTSRKSRAAGTAFGAARTGLRSIAMASKIGAAGLLGFGVTTAKMGIGFNATMEQQTVAFEGFLGSTDKASAHLDSLFALSTRTPFEFEDVVGASRKLLAFGQTAQQSNRWLSTIGDTAAGIGGGAPEIDRLVGAIGQIQAKGKASTEEMLQLAELGVPAFDILAKKTGRSMGQVFDDLSAGTITSKVALDALSKGLDEQFGGAAAKQAETYNGQVSTMKDNARLLAKTASKPLYEHLRTSVLPTVNRLLTALTTGFQASGVAGLVAAFDRATGAGGRVNRTFEYIRETIRGIDFAALGQRANQALTGIDFARLADEAKAFVSGVDWGGLGQQAGDAGRQLKTMAGWVAKAFEIPGVRQAAIAFGAIALSLGAVNKATGGAAGGLGRTGLATMQMATASIGLGTALIGSNLSLKMFSLAAIRARLAATGNAIATRTMALAAIRARIAGAAAALATRAWAGAQKILNLAMRANPLMKVVTVIGLLAGGLVLAYKKSETFRTIVDGAFRGVKTIAGSVIAFVMRRFSDLLGGFSSIATAASKIPGIGDKFKRAAVGIDGARAKIDAAADEMDRLGRKKVSLSVKVTADYSALRTDKIAQAARSGSLGAGPMAGARALGGPVSAGKSYLVGERGTEMFTPRESGIITPNDDLPAGARLGSQTPAAPPPASAGAAGQQAAERSDNGQLVAAIRQALGTMVIEQHVHTHLDSREIAVSVRRHGLRDLAARSTT